MIHGDPQVTMGFYAKLVGYVILYEWIDDPQLVYDPSVDHGTYGGFHKWGYPQIIHFSRIFQYKQYMFHLFVHGLSNYNPIIYQ